MRALIVAPQPFFSPRGTPFSVYYRTLISSELGVKIDLLTYGQGEDVEIPGVRIIRIPAFRFLGPVPLGPSLLKLWLDLFMIIWAIALLIRNRYEFVHAHEESVFFLRYLKPIFRFKLVYDMHSSLPQQLRNFQFTKSRLIYRIFEKLEDTCLAQSSAVITICPELAKYALSRMSDDSRHLLIENSLYDEVRFANRRSRDDALEFLDEIPDDRPVIAYAGSFEAYQGLDLLLQGFKKVCESRPDAFLLMIGGLPRQVDQYRVRAESLGIARDCLFTGRIEPSAVRVALKRASILVSPRTRGINTPLKIYEQLDSGIPLVATRILSHTQILDDRVCFLVDPEPDSMASGLLRALNDEEKRAEVVTGAQALYEREYSRSVYMKKMNDLLARLR